MSIAAAIVVIGLITTVAVGSFWIALAALDGEPIVMLLRFALTVLVGVSYAVWLLDNGYRVRGFRVRRP